MSYQVAKAIIGVHQDHGPAHRYLMSIKRDPGSENEGKLEFLGGRMEDDELPDEGLLRELSEEEATGNLVALARDKIDTHLRLQIGDTQHFIFAFHISLPEYQSLEYDPVESFGYKLIDAAQLVSCEATYTRKTNQIISALNLKGTGAAGR